MRTIYSKEQLWEIYKKLPEQVRNILSSEDTADVIFDICKKNDLTEGQASVVSGIINEVVFGILPVADFPKTIKAELGLKEDAIKKLFQEIDRSVFSPVSAAKGEKPKEEIENPVKTVTKGTEVEKKLSAEDKEKPKTYSKNDTYRESLE